MGYPAASIPPMVPQVNAPPPPAEAVPGFWRRRIVRPVLDQLAQGVSPEKIALALALGSALALFPILGTTTLLCLAAGFVFRLNQAILQAINGLCALIWIPMLAAFVRLGDALSRRTASLDLPLMFSLFRHHPAEFLHRFGITAAHAMLGWAVVAPVWIGLGYLALRFPLRAATARLERRRQLSD
jgi:uncharacterized protein (DUF2062 family)